MATFSHNTTILTPQTAADVRALAVHAQAARARLWPVARKPLPAGNDSPKAVIPEGYARAVISTEPRPVIGRISVRRVLEATAGHFGLTVSDLTSECRVRKLTRSRQIAMYVASKVTGRSLMFIGRHMDRDHTTILHGVRAVKALVDARHAETVEAVNAIVGKLGAGKGGAQ